MADIEKVKKSLHCCTEDNVDMGCSVCEYRSYEEECTSALAFDALSVIEDQQKEIERLKAEQPKIIRCKDCKYGVKHELDLSNMYECGYPFTIVQEGHFGDFFCAMAEPKEGEKK